MPRFIPSDHPFAAIQVGQLVWLENDNYGNPKRYWRTIYQQAATKRAFMLLSALQWYVENDDVEEDEPDNAYWITGKRWAQTIIKAVNEGTPESLISEKRRFFSEELVGKLRAEMLSGREESTGPEH